MVNATKVTATKCEKNAQFAVLTFLLGDPDMATSMNATST